MTDSIDKFFSEWSPRLERGKLPNLPEDAQFVYRFMRVCRILGDRLDATCRRHGLTRSQFEAMAIMLRRHPEPLGAGDLMKAAFLTSGSVTAMLNQLMRNGLVHRQAHKEDKRRIEVQLTAAGRQRIEAAISERIRDNTSLARLLPEEPRTELNRCMRQFLAAAEALAETST